MISDFERYHGAVLRDLIICAKEPVKIETFDDAGRVNSYLINDEVGFHIKHSSKRTPPWSFTFTDENVEELGRLARRTGALWISLVCGTNGILSLSWAEFQAINPPWARATSFVRVDCDKRTMYRVFGTNGKLPSAKPRGTFPVLADLRSRRGAPA